jgi:hypothetical protein
MKNIIPNAMKLTVLISLNDVLSHVITVTDWSHALSPITKSAQKPYYIKQCAKIQRLPNYKFLKCLFDLPSPHLNGATIIIAPELMTGCQHPWQWSI